MSISEPARTVAVIGLGNLGQPIAERLLHDSWDVTVFDRRPDAVDACVRGGAKPAAAVADLADCSVISVVVSDDAAVTQVLRSSGLLDALTRDAVVAIHSTILPTTARELAQSAADRGVGLLDAQVSGGPDRARDGTLAVMTGGAPETVTRAEPYFRTIANTVVHAGPPGAGAATKLGNQLMMFAALAATYEATELVAAYGVSAETLFAATEHSTGDCWIARNWGFFDRIAGEYNVAGMPLRNRPWCKDLWDVVAAARTADIRLPVAGLLAQLMPDRVEAHAAES